MIVAAYHPSVFLVISFMCLIPGAPWRPRVILYSGNSRHFEIHLCFFFNGWSVVDTMAPRLFGVHSDVILSSRRSFESVHEADNWSASTRLLSYLFRLRGVLISAALFIYSSPSELEQFEEVSKYKNINSSQVKRKSQEVN